MKPKLNIFDKKMERSEWGQSKRYRNVKDEVIDQTWKELWSLKNKCVGTNLYPYMGLGMIVLGTMIGLC